VKLGRFSFRSGFASAVLGIALALVLGAPARRLLPWMMASVVFWGMALTVSATFGFDVLPRPRRA
jgi:predicted Kef-type K+ transport protein